MNLRTFAPLLLLLSAIAAAVPQAMELFSHVRRYGFFPPAEQRRSMNGRWYDELRSKRPILELEDVVTIVAVREHDIGAAALASSELFPLRTQLYVGVEDLSRVAAKLPRYPRRVLVADRASGAELRLSTYDELTGASLDPAVRDAAEAALVHSVRRGAHLVVPLAVRGGGVGADWYFTALKLHNDRGADVPLRLALRRDGQLHTKKIVVAGGETLRVWDALRDLFALEAGTGWLEVVAETDINVSAALVNRGRAAADAVVPQRRRCDERVFAASVIDPSSAKFWLLNQTSVSATATIRTTTGAAEHSRTITVLAASQVNIPLELPIACAPCIAHVAISAPCEVIAFASEKDHERGGTRFAWPEEPAR